MGSASLSELADLDRIQWLEAGEMEKERVLELADEMLPKEKNWINEWF